MAEQCKFDEAWIGRCKNYPLTTDQEMCEKHAGLVCCGCGKPAVRSCDHTGQFVCGFKLCADCKHAPLPDGSPGYFGMGGTHKPSKEADAEWQALWSKR